MNIIKLSSKKSVVGLLIVVLVVGGGVALHTRSVHKAQHTSGVIPNSKNSGAAKSSGNSSDKSQTKNTASSTATSTKAQGSAVTSSAALVAPFGSFVSNHKPGQNSPTSEESVCNTTPGATCDIQFTNSSGVTKNLGAEVADSTGTAYWSWNINGGTLAPGSWQITAVVKLNGQTKTSSDPTPLEVQ